MHHGTLPRLSQSNSWDCWLEQVAEALTNHWQPRAETLLEQSRTVGQRRSDPAPDWSESLQRTFDAAQVYHPDQDYSWVSLEESLVPILQSVEVWLAAAPHLVKQPEFENSSRSTRETAEEPHATITLRGDLAGRRAIEPLRRHDAQTVSAAAGAADLATDA